jgi:zinc transporter ZupT
MLIAVLTVFVPLALACLSFAVVGQAYLAGLGVSLPLVLTAAAGLLFVWAAVQAIGSGVFASMNKEARDRGLTAPVDQEDEKSKRRASFQWLAAGAVVLAVALVLDFHTLVALAARVLSA